MKTQSRAAGEGGLIVSKSQISQLLGIRMCSQSVLEEYLLLKKPPDINKKILTTPKISPETIVFIKAFRMISTLDVKIV